MKYYIVKYTGPFGFIKPWTAVRDGETFSQQFLTPSIVEGMEKKLFPELLSDSGKIHKIKRHRLNYTGLSTQQERTWPKGMVVKNIDKKKFRLPELSILKRGVLLEPNLYLAFSNLEDAEIALSQHLCLCRNEDVLLPIELLIMTNQEFDELPGFELHFKALGEGFKVGQNRFAEGAPMFGEMQVYGNPIRQPKEY